MVHRMKGDLFRTDVDVYVIPVNCVGVARRGVAAQFKHYFPDEYLVYRVACQKGQVQIGRVLVIPVNSFIKPKYIIAFPTKRHWKEHSKLEYIEEGLKALVEAVRKYPIYSIAMPALGCGAGKLSWDQVDRVIEEYVEKYLRGKLVFVLLPREEERRSDEEKWQARSENTEATQNSPICKRSCTEYGCRCRAMGFNTSSRHTACGSHCRGRCR